MRISYYVMVFQREVRVQQQGGLWLLQWSLSDDCGSLALNLPPITIKDKPCPDKRSGYTPDLIPAAISVSSEKIIINLINPSDSPQLLLLTSDYPYPRHIMNKDKPYRGKMKRGYCSRKRCHKKWGFIAPHTLINKRNFITVMGFSGIIQRWGIPSWNINILWTFVQLIYVFSSIISFTLPVELVCVLIFVLLQLSHPVPIPLSDLF